MVFGIFPLYFTEHLCRGIDVSRNIPVHRLEWLECAVGDVLERSEPQRFLDEQSLFPM